MFEVIRLAVGIIVTLFIGWILLRIILHKRRRPLLEELAFSYGLGMGAVALEQMLFWYIGIRPTLVNMLIPWLAAFFFAVKIGSLKNEGISGRSKPLLKDFSPFEIFLISGITLEVFFSFFRALIKPIESFDSIAMYAIRAKIFYQAGGIPKGFFSTVTPAFPNASYPLLMPLIERWTYVFMGSFNDFLVKSIFPIFFVSALIIFYFAVKEYFTRRNALMFTFLLATIPQFNRFSSIGYADFVLAFFFTAGFLNFFYYMKNRDTRQLVLSGLFMGFCCWTKMEGWALSAGIITISIIFAVLNLKWDKKTLLKTSLFIAVILMISLPWIFIINNAHLESDVYGAKAISVDRVIASLSNFDRLPHILYEFQKQFFGPKKWNLIWILFLGLFFLNTKKAFRGDIKYPTILLLLVMAGYSYSYLLIPIKEGGSINWNIASTLSRLFIHFTPLALYWIASVCNEKGYID